MFLLRSHLPSYFNGIEVVVAIGPLTNPELGQTEVLVLRNCWLPQIEVGFGSIVLILRCCSYGILLNERARVKLNEKFHKH